MSQNVEVSLLRDASRVDIRRDYDTDGAPYDRYVSTVDTRAISDRENMSLNVEVSHVNMFLPLIHAPYLIERTCR